MAKHSIKIKCKHCGCEDIRKNGKDQGFQVFICLNSSCGRQFRHEYQYKAYNPETQLKILEMSKNGSGIRDITRVLGVSKYYVSKILKKNATIC